MKNKMQHNKDKLLFKLNIKVMKSIKTSLFCIALFAFTAAKSQNVGIGTDNPTQKLDVIGKVKADSLLLNYGGERFDFLMKNNNNGDIGFKKGHGGLGLNYIICLFGSPPGAGGPLIQGPMIGEIRLFAGHFAPAGWVFCHGQYLSVIQNTQLYSIIGSVYGGDGIHSFALPDLRGAAAVGAEALWPGAFWSRGERTY